VNARHWLRRHYADLTEDDVRRVGSLLFDLWKALRQSGVYHADFKLYNLLIPPDRDLLKEGFGLIDIDAVRMGGGEWSRRDILRNLVQLNGSLGGWIPPDIRLTWLERLAADEPWVLEPEGVAAVERETRERLDRELRRIDGP